MDATREARLSPLPTKQWPPEMAGAIAAMQPPNPRHPPLKREGRPKGMNALGTLARHPELARAWNTFNGHVLLASTISPRQRELLVLRVASLRKSTYEWAQHAVLAHDVGLSAEDVARVVAGPEASGWSSLDRALLRAADELVGDAVISDETWAELATELDERQLMDVVFTVGAYEVLAMAFRSFGIELDDDLRK